MVNYCVGEKMKYFLYFVVSMLISALLIIPVKKIGDKYNLIAQENQRTIHHGRIVRIGGVAIYLSFMFTSLFVIHETRAFDGLLIGASIIFVFGLLDDIFDLKPIVKLIGQFLAATAAIFIGRIYLTNIHLILGIEIKSQIISYAITYLWMMGVTNAINLIDGLDGLAGGFCIIVLFTLSMLSTLLGNSTFMIPICLILAGATLGFLIYNFHPASIFMGDCGSQLLGFVIASISLYGFRKATFITLGIPILLLFVPISDTLLAIVRRKLKGQKIMSPDKGHLHHMLMNNMRLGQVGAVIVIYVVTALFGLTAYLCIVDVKIGIVLLVFLILLFDIFIEYTGMISPKYRPILNVLDKFKKSFERS